MSRGALPCCSSTRRDSDVELAEQLRRHRRRDERLTARDRAHRVGDLVDRHLLQEVAGRAGAHRGEQVLLVLGDGEHHDLRTSGCALADAARRLDAARRRACARPSARRRVELGGPLDRLEPVGGLADDLEVGLGREHQLEPAPEQRVVVDDEDADRARVLARLPRSRCLGSAGHLDEAERAVAAAVEHRGRPVSVLGTGRSRGRAAPSGARPPRRPSASPRTASSSRSGVADSSASSRRRRARRRRPAPSPSCRGAFAPLRRPTRRSCSRRIWCSTLSSARSSATGARRRGACPSRDDG